jgi:hypothetical protein
MSTGNRTFTVPFMLGCNVQEYGKSPVSKNVPVQESPGFKIGLMEMTGPRSNRIW